jgi:acetylornithine/N-succinyldiaminopimelate aminotransferase
MKTWIDLEEKYYMYAARRQPIVLVRGAGTEVWDENGKRYLDFTAGWAVNNVGHVNKEVVQAIVNQANTLMQTSNQFYTVPQLELAQLLVDNSCLDRVFFCNSGAEANEGAVKLARKYGREQLNGAYEIITALNSFHGRTLTMAAATGQPHYQEAWQPLIPGFIHVPFDDIDALKTATTEKTCAILLEPVEAEGGVITPQPDYLKNVREWCDDKGILLILDEVQTGMGRLGTLFGYQNFDVEPDIITLAKGLGGGVPIGAILAKEHAALFVPGDHGSTFGGNPLTCAAARATVQYLLDHHIPDHAVAMGKRLRTGLEILASEFEGVIEVRGMGLLLAVQFRDNIAADIVASSNEAGLLLNPVRPDTVRIMPPLTVTESEIDEALQLLTRVLGKTIQNG